MYYITCDNQGLKVVFEHKILYYQMTIQAFIKQLCIKHLTSYEAITKASKKILNIQSKIPLYLSEHLLLFPTHGFKNQQLCFINYNLLLGAYNGNDGLYLYFNNAYLKVDISLSVLNKLLNNCLKVKEYKTLSYLYF